MTDSNTVFIGMDLGTFKTSVCSSNGRRGVLPSAVGRPRDHVARTMLGRDVVFGEDVFEQRLAMDVIRPFQKGVLKYVDCEDGGISSDDVDSHLEAAKLLVEHAVSLTEPGADKKVYGVIGAPSRATILNKQVVLDAVHGTFDAAMIVAEPFTVAYGMGKLKDALVVDIGAGTIDICPMYGTYPSEEDQVTLSLGGDVIDDEFCKRLAAEHPTARVSLNMARKIKEKHGFVHDVDEKAIVTLPTDGKPGEFDVTDQLKAACRSIVKPIVDGLREVIAKFDPEFRQSLLDNIVLGGGGSGLKGLDRLVEDALVPYGGGKVTKVYDSVFAGAVGALNLAMNMPAEYWEQLQSQHESGDDTSSDTGDDPSYELRAAA